MSEDPSSQPRWPDDPAQQWQPPTQGAYPPSYPPPSAYPSYPGYPGGYPPEGQQPYGFVPPYPGPMAPSTSGWAIASLILAITGWTVFPLLGAIGGVVTGHIALHEIATSQGRVVGRGFAVAGLIVGYAALVLTVCAVIFGIGLLIAASQTH